MRSLPVASIFLAGVIHLVLAPQHYAHAPAHGIFFALAGVAEILWALAFWRRPSPGLYRGGVALAGGLVVLWAITRVFVAPFGHDPEPIEIGGLVCKSSELIGIIALVMLASQGRLNDGVKRPAVRAVAEALVLALVLGLGSYAAGHAAGPMLPMLGHVEEHASDHMHETTTPGGHEHSDMDEMATPSGHVHTHEEPGHETATPGAVITLGHLQIEGAWTRPVSAGDTTAVYLTIVNTGDMADALIAVQSEAAQAAELHEMRMEGDVMQMRPVDRIEVPAGGRVELEPSGYHIMLIGLAEDLTAGDHVHIVLEFEHSGQVTVEAEAVAP